MPRTVAKCGCFLVRAEIETHLALAPSDNSEFSLCGEAQGVCRAMKQRLSASSPNPHRLMQNVFRLKASRMRRQDMPIADSIAMLLQRTTTKT
jgi:hypothetical protein